MPACTQASWNTPEMPVGPSYRERARPSLAAVSSSCAEPVTWIGRVCGTSASSAPSPITVATWWSTAILSSSSQNARQRKFGSMPCTRMTSLGESGEPAGGQPGGRPVDGPGHAVDQPDGRPGDLEVVETLRIQFGQRRRVPGQAQLLDGGRCGVAGVVPPLEGGDHHRVAQGLELTHAGQPTTRARRLSARIAEPAGARLGERAHGGLPGPVTVRPRLDGPRAVSDLISTDAPAAGRARASASSSRTARWARCCRPRTRRWTTSPGSRAATRSSTSPGRTSSGRCTAPTSRSASTPIETNTFGANLANLAEYDIADRIYELRPGRRRAGPRRGRRLRHAGPARGSCSARSGPAPSCRRSATPRTRRCATPTQQQVAGMLDGGVDAVIVETCQDLLQAKSAVLAAKRAMTATGISVPIIVHVTVETTGTMLLGSEIGAALTALEPLGVDYIGLNCATGPAEMSEHLRYLSRHARIGVSVMPNAGLPELGPNGAVYPLTPGELAEALSGFVREFGLGLVGGCCGTTPEHLRQVVEAVREVAPATRRPRPEPGLSSLYQAVPFAAGRVGADDRRADERQRLQGVPGGHAGRRSGRTASRSPARRPGTARTCWTCAWTTSGRDGAADMREHGRPAGHRVDAADHAGLDRAAGDRGRPGAARRPLHRQLGELRGRRRPGVPVRPGHAAGPGARRRGRRPDHRRGGPGPHPGAQAGHRRAADRRPHRHLGHARVATS